MNKKIVLFIVAAVVIFSISIVTIFGLKADIGRNDVRVSKIQIVDVNGDVISKPDQYGNESYTYNFMKDKDKIQLTNTIVIYYRVIANDETKTPTELSIVEPIAIDAEFNKFVSSVVVDETRQSITLHLNGLPNTWGTITIHTIDGNKEVIVELSNVIDSEPEPF